MLGPICWSLHLHPGGSCPECTDSEPSAEKQQVMHGHSLASNQKFTHLARFIRSIQRIEGHADCFGKVVRDCRQWDCVWRAYCLMETRKDSNKDVDDHR